MFLGCILMAVPAKIKMARETRKKGGVFVDIRVFNDILTAGESLEWVGRSEHWSLWDSEIKKVVVSYWCYCLFAAFMASSILKLWSYAAGHFVSIHWYLLFFGLAFLFGFSPLLERFIIRNRKYALTSRRILICENSGVVHEIQWQELDAVIFTDAGIRRMNVVFGAELMGSSLRRQYRTALHPVTLNENTKKITGMVFFYLSQEEYEDMRSLIPSGILVVDERRKGK